MSHLKPLEFKECVIDSPAFREKLLLHEKEIDNSVKVFKDIYSSIKNVYKTLEDCSVAFKELADNLKKFTSRGDHKYEAGIKDTQVETEDEKKIRSAVAMYSDLISNIEAMRREHILGATKDIVMDDLQSLKENCLSRSKRDIKEFKKTTANYYMKLEKYSAIKYKPDAEYENIDAEFREDRLQYVNKALTHVMNIQETEEQKTCKLVHTLSLLIQMLNTYHHQAWDHFGDQKKKIDDVNCALYRTEESYTSIAKDTENLKQQILNLPIEHIQPDPKVEGETIREGYLFVLTKKAVMYDLWTRKFCIYEKSSKKLIMFQSIQTIQSNSLKMQSEEYSLISCERKMSGSIDRRFSFRVKIKNLSTPMTLQALTKEDLTQWMLIMDGKEPIYAQLQDNKVIQELETILNDKVLKFLSMCFSEIERKGIDIPGIYRTSGRMGQRDILMKKIRIDVCSLSSDIITSRELELIDVNTLCSVVKSYIKFLKIPMATYILYDEFIASGKLQESNEKFNAVLRVIKKLPPDHLQLFTIVIKHLYRVSQNQQKNLMTAPNLGVCFSPTIFRPEQGNASLTAIRESKFAADVISMLIERCNEFFPQINSYQKVSLSPSRSMYISRDEREDVNISPLMARSHLESAKFPHNNVSPKPNLRRHVTEIYPTEPKSSALRPPIIAPKPDISKFSPKSIHLSLRQESVKSQLLDGSYPKRSLLKAKTLYVFVAENEVQLSFDPNKIVTNVSDSEEIGWIVGTIDGRVGLIPRSYVEILPS